MSTTAEKLAYLSETKGLIQDKINQVGGGMPDGTPFRQYPDYITGGGPTPPGPIDPVEYYNTHRPTDWMPMTPDDEMLENTIELLCELGDDDSNFFGFTVIGSNLTYSIDGGSPVSFSSNTATYITLKKSDYPNHPVSNGNNQIMITISGLDISSLFFPKNNPARNYAFSNYNIVEIKEKCTGGTSFTFYAGINSETSGVQYRLTRLRFATLLGTKPLANAFMFYSCYSLEALVKCNHTSGANYNYMFNSCRSLKTIPALDTSNVTTMSSMFNSCYSLQTIPALDTSKVTTMETMFYGCYSLQTIPELNTSKVTTMSSMFNSCSSLQTIPALDTSKVTTMETMFYGCYSLQTIPALDTSNVTTMRYMFYSCSSLQELVLTGGLPSSISASNAAINLSNSCMGRTSMVAFFQSLPNITGATAQGALITYTGTPAVLTLTAADKLIATGKGWVLNPA